MREDAPNSIVVFPAAPGPKDLASEVGALTATLDRLDPAGGADRSLGPNVSRSKRRFQPHAGPKLNFAGGWIQEEGRVRRSPAGRSAAEDSTDERPPTSLRTVPTGHPRGLFGHVLVLSFLADVANVLHQIVIALLGRVPTNRTPRNLDNEGRDQKQDDHPLNVVGCEQMSNTG